MREERTYFKEGLLTEEQSEKMYREVKELSRGIDKSAVERSIEPFLEAFGED